MASAVIELMQQWLRAGTDRSQHACVYGWFAPPLPPHFNVGTGVASSGHRLFMVVPVWWPTLFDGEGSSHPTLKWGGARDG